VTPVDLHGNALRLGDEVVVQSGRGRRWSGKIERFQPERNALGRDTGRVVAYFYDEADGRTRHVLTERLLLVHELKARVVPT
jgi:hypothetical protein